MTSVCAAPFRLHSGPRSTPRAGDLVASLRSRWWRATLFAPFARTGYVLQSRALHICVRTLFVSGTGLGALVNSSQAVIASLSRPHLSDLLRESHIYLILYDGVLPSLGDTFASIALNGERLATLRMSPLERMSFGHVYTLWRVTGNIERATGSCQSWSASAPPKTLSGTRTPMCTARWEKSLRRRA